MVYLTLFFINLKILESDDDSSIDSRYINLDIPVNLDRKTTKKNYIVDNVGYRRQRQNKDSQKELREYFANQYYDKYRQTVCKTYHSCWNEYFTFLFS